MPTEVKRLQAELELDDAEEALDAAKKTLDLWSGPLRVKCPHCLEEWTAEFETHPREAECVACGWVSVLDINKGKLVPRWAPREAA